MLTAIGQYIEAGSTCYQQDSEFRRLIAFNTSHTDTPSNETTEVGCLRKFQNSSTASDQLATLESTQT
uniref:Uncharacterized protein n=1 Tax=Steinernema glaseri TaxID=37863 RepID=A0A1I7ZA87_9BILA